MQDGGSAGGRRPQGTPLELPSLDLGFLEAALAADLITARNCTYSREAALAADLFMNSRTVCFGVRELVFRGGLAVSTANTGSPNQYWVKVWLKHLAYGTTKKRNQGGKSLEY